MNTPGARAALILGVPVDDVTFAETVDLIFDLVADGQATGRTHQVATVNVDFIVNAVRDPSLGAILRRTSLSIPDGMPVVWGARLMRTPLRTRVAGADLVAAIAERAASTGTTVHLFGAAPGIADRAAALLRDRFPGAAITSEAGPMIKRVDELDPIELDSLRASRPDICCVAFGNPKQEQFIDRFGDDLADPGDDRCRRIARLPRRREAPRARPGCSGPDSSGSTGRPPSRGASPCGTRGMRSSSVHGCSSRSGGDVGDDAAAPNGSRSARGSPWSTCRSCAAPTTPLPRRSPRRCGTPPAPGAEQRSSVLHTTKPSTMSTACGSSSTTPFRADHGIACCDLAVTTGDVVLGGWCWVRG